ncbi:CD44 antigen isoform X1 [Pelobates cultripes]|uniref:CD44 antigen n=1 Tax=Pelobates cultripes TaxID=61616 RepID=A0AAD1TIS4_PELCU|nr:CD44 antigen isoform X1 [Pelobates cultripes]
MITRMLWIYTIGLCALITFCQEQTVISCRFKGVFHVEENGRYKISRETAEDVCLSLNSTLADYEQIKIAYDVGFETCRYGFIRETIVIPRKTPNSICAANHIGIYNLTTNISNLYDVYCFNASGFLSWLLEPSRQITEITEIKCSFKRVEFKGNDANTDLLTKVIIQKMMHELTGARRERIGDGTLSDLISPHYYGDYGDYVSSSEPRDYGDNVSSSELRDYGDYVSSSELRDYGDNVSSSELRDFGDDEIIFIGACCSGTELLYQNSNDIAEGLDEHCHAPKTFKFDGFEHAKQTSHTAPSSQGRVSLSSRVWTWPIPYATSMLLLPENLKTNYYEDSKGSGTPKGGRRGNSGQVLLEDPSNATNKPKQRRGSRVPDWLIVVVAVVSLGLILSVCIALNTRRLCGQKRKLVINGKKASVEDGGIIDQNGDTAKSQEMVQLVSHDPPEPSVTMTNEDIRNTKDVDMKIGV